MVSCILAYRNVELAGDLLAYGGYYAVGLSFLAWILAISYRQQRQAWQFSLRAAETLYSGFRCSVYYVVVTLSVKPGYRVLSDESNLIAVSRSMAFDKKVYNTTMSQWGSEGFIDLENLLPTRPLL